MMDTIYDNPTSPLLLTPYEDESDEEYLKRIDRLLDTPLSDILPRLTQEISLIIRQLPYVLAR